MNFRSISDLNNALVSLLPKIPRDLDLIVGIPRSGLLAANILALHLNLPLTDLDGFLKGKIIATGHRETLKINPQNSSENQIKKILIIDDSLASGNTLREIKEQIKALKNPNTLIYYAAVYVVPGQENAVDFFAEICCKPRMFEWNIMHHPRLGKSCVDIDGVLCVDPKKNDNDDGLRYKNFIETCPPLFLPSVPLGYVVTCRLEKYRVQTEQWLKRNNINYKQLFMLSFPDKKTRKQAGNYAEFKAQIYRKTKAELFIESSLEQAQEIANISGKYVYCVQTKEMIDPSSFFSKTRLTAKKNLKQLLFYRIKNAVKNSPLYQKLKKILKK